MPIIIKLIASKIPTLTSKLAFLLCLGCSDILSTIGGPSSNCILMFLPASSVKRATYIHIRLPTKKLKVKITCTIDDTFYLLDTCVYK